MGSGSRHRTSPRSIGRAMRPRSPSRPRDAASAAAPTGLAQFGRRGLGKVRRLVAGGPASGGLDLDGLAGPARTPARDDRATRRARDRTRTPARRPRARAAAGRDRRRATRREPVPRPGRRSHSEGRRSSRSRSTSRPASTTTPGGRGSTAPDGARLLPSSAIWRAGEADERRREETAGSRRARRSRGSPPSRPIRTPVIVHGVDLGPALVGRVSQLAARWMPSKVRAVTRSERCSVAFDRPACSWPTSTTARTG